MTTCGFCTTADCNCSVVTSEEKDMLLRNALAQQRQAPIERAFGAHAVVPDGNGVLGAPAGIALTQAADKMSVDQLTATLAERGSRYGVFTEHARITQTLKAMMRNSPRWAQLRADQEEALEMIAHKIGRILNGDPNYADSWVDIAGYAKLVADRLEGTAR